MKNSLILATTLALGCAGTPKGNAVQLTVFSDAMADEIGSGWSGSVDAQIAHCKNTLGEGSTKAQRSDCMGMFGKGEPLEAGLTVLVTTQTAIAEGVKCEELHSCPSAIDWDKLYNQLVEAVKTIRPYFDAMKGQNK